MVQFSNGSDKMAKLRRNQAIGILDLRSIGYFKVGYQKMVNMAESSKAFQMYHYQQTTKESADSEDSFMRATCLERDTQDPMLKKLGDTATSKYRKDPYPWLDVDDPRRFQSDEEILYEKIDLSKSALTRKEKSKLMKMIIRYREAFSLRDEIGNCPNLKADIKVIDESLLDHFHCWKVTNPSWTSRWKG